MEVKIVYEYESALGAKIRHAVVAKNDKELTEYVSRLILAQYELIEIKHINE